MSSLNVFSAKAPVSPTQMMLWIVKLVLVIVKNCNLSGMTCKWEATCRTSALTQNKPRSVTHECQVAEKPPGTSLDLHEAKNKHIVSWQQCFPCLQSSAHACGWCLFVWLDRTNRKTRIYRRNHIYLHTDIKHTFVSGRFASMRK